jgi:hypothetical protein
VAADPSEPAPDVETSALDAWTEMRRAEARLMRLEAQLDVVGQAVAALRGLLTEEVEARRRLMARHAAAIEAETRAEYTVLCARLETVRAAYDQLAGGLDETIQRHAERQIDEATFARAQRASSDSLRASAAELARLDQLRVRFEAALGETPAAVAPVRPAPAPVAPAPVVPAPAAVPPPPPPVPAVTAAVPVAAPRAPVEPEVGGDGKPSSAAEPALPPPEPGAPGEMLETAGDPMTPVPLAGVPFPQPLPTPVPLAEPDEPEAVLIETHEASSGASHRVRDGLQIGRSIENQLRVLDPSVSRQHATIAIRSGAFVLEDLRSQNGTFVNGERIRQRVLCDGDRINIGEAEFLFRAEDNRQSASPHGGDPPGVQSRAVS